MNRSSLRTAGGFAAAVLLLAGCSSAGGDAVEGATPPDAAKAKKQATAFRTISMPDDWNNYGEFWQAVCDQNDLGCDGSAESGKSRKDDSEASSADVIQQFRDDKQNPGVCGDIGIAFSGAADENNVGLKYVPDSVEKLPERYRSTEGNWFSHVSGVISFLVSPELKDPPKTFDDLLDPRFKGKVGMSDPRESGTGQATVFAVAAALGEGEPGTPESFDLDGAFKFFGTLAEQRQFSAASFDAQTFKRGEVQVKIAYDFVNLETAAGLKDEGLDAEVYIPEDGGVFSPSVLICNANTQHPDLAKLAMDYAISDEGQKLFASIGAHPIRYITGDLELSDEDKKNWLPDEQYSKVEEFPGDNWPDAAEIAQRWDEEVLN